MMTLAAAFHLHYETPFTYHTEEGLVTILNDTISEDDLRRKTCCLPLGHGYLCCL
jgi:hypothetical protein